MPRGTMEYNRCTKLRGMESSEPRQAADDRLILPATWRRHVLPRRGRDGANADLDTALDPGAPEAVARRIAEKRPQIEEWFGNRKSDLRPVVTDHLQGRPDPAGAAALLHLLDSTEHHRAETNTIAPATRLRHLDAWVAEHGLAFAAAAVLESAMLYNLTFAQDDRAIAEAGLSRYLKWDEPNGWRHAQPALHRLRSLLAAAAEPEYREAVAAVAERRTDPQRCIGAALIMPTEADWVEEAVIAATGSFDERRADDWMIWSIVADPRDWHLAEHRGIRHIDARSLAPLIDGVGTAALPKLTGSLYGRFDALSKPARAALATAIGLLPADEATSALIERLDLPGMLTAAMATAERFPQRTLRAVTARAEHADPEERQRLQTLLNSSPVLETALDGADETTRETVAALRDTAGRVPDAPAEALPPLLAAPPWKTKRRKAAQTVIDGLAPAHQTRLVWGDLDEAQRWATLHEDMSHMRYDAAAVTRMLAYFEEHEETADTTAFMAWAEMEHAAPLFERWNGICPRPSTTVLTRLLGRFGLPAADRIAALAMTRNGLAEVLMPIQNLPVARAAADWLSRKSMAPIAKRWFERHTDAAAHLLVPDALSGDKTARRTATAALRYLIDAYGAETASAAAKDYGEAAAEAIDALIATDPLEPLHAKIPKPPSWAAPAMLPQVLLKGQKLALPPASLEHLTTVLAVDSSDFPYAGVDVVAEACDPASLTRFSRALFELWTAAGAPSKDGWAFTQLAHFADDDTVAELAALIRDWPGQGQHKRAVTGLRVLGAIGTETSLRALHGIARKVGFKALKEEANRQVEAVAEHLGLTAEQLADRLVPGLGLEADLVLDYGPRRFHVGLDEQLQPFVTAEDGKPLKRLPKPGPNDDEAAAAAYERYARLKRDLRAVAKEQVQRLERAMVQGRTWTVPQFREYFADHPLMRHLARRLVWLAEADGTRSGFRIAEDRTFTDAADDAFDLPEDAAVALAHPVALGDRLAAWAELFADYEILQPFPQLARPVRAFTDEELATGRLARFEGATLPTGRVYALLHAGWIRGPGNGLWVEPGLHRPLPGGGFAVIALDPGIDGYQGRIDSSQPDQTVRAAYLSATASYDGPGGRGDHPTGIDPVAASEVLGSLAKATATA
jgi:hypothetical protein